MSTIEIRTPAPHELDAYLKAMKIGFGGSVNFPDGQRESFLKFVNSTHNFAAFDGDQVVGTMGYFDFETSTVKSLIPTAGITAVTVSPTHRRRGILTRMMAAAMEDAVEREKATASLYASETPIYGRFGYGITVFRERQKISRGKSMLKPVAAGTGSVRQVTAGDHLSQVKDVFNRVGVRRLGWIMRTDHAWHHRFEDPEWDRKDDGELLSAIYFEEGKAEGYVLYRRAGDDRSSLKIEELVATDHYAELALWRYCFGVDLVEEVSMPGRPVDDSLPWMLQDMRALERVPQDSIWTRILDVPTVLQSRSYPISGELVIEVKDESGGHAAGTFALSATPDGAICSPTASSPDLTMNVAQLGTIAFGGGKPSVLARSGLIDVHDTDALNVSDGMFATQHAPWNVIDF
ncbi:MAG: GNAT family N-acetyltransferase [Chloroflexi bacterium]|nr:GNAT family N-acetyltransferase [Chloroflexota bacterium]